MTWKKIPKIPATGRPYILNKELAEGEIKKKKTQYYKWSYGIHNEDKRERARRNLSFKLLDNREWELN